MEVAAVHGDLIGLLLSVSLVLLCGSVSALVYIYGKSALGENRSEVARKIIHIGVSNFFFIYAHVFENDIWPIAGLLSFALLNALMNKKGILNKLMGQDNRNRNWGLVAYPLSILLLILLRLSGFGSITSLGCAILGMGYGDGLASLVGKSLKSRRISENNNKTVAGCLTMALVVFAVTLIMKLTYGQSDLNNALVSALVTSAIATFVEAYTPFGLDNISVPITIYMVAELI